MSLRPLLCWLVAVVPLSSVAQSPSAAEIFAKSGQSYRAFQTLRVDVEWNYAMDGRGSIPYMELESDRTTSWIEPANGLIRVESKGSKAVSIVDGTYLYEYSNRRKEFTKRPAPTDFDKLMNVKIWQYPEIFQMTEPVISGSDKVKVSGKEFNCWILEARVLPGDPTASVQLGATPGPMRVWIDKDSGLPLKSEMRWNLGSGLTTAVSSMKVTALQFNGPIPPGTFVFVPPKNAKEVPEFGGKK